MKKYFKAIQQFKSFIEKYPNQKIYLCEFYKSGNDWDIIQKIKATYENGYIEPFDYFPSQETQEIKLDIINFVINNDILFFVPPTIAYQNFLPLYYINSFSIKNDIAAVQIQRFWRKYILKRKRELLDPLKRDLMAYLYHPSRLTFDPDDYQDIN